MVWLSSLFWFGLFWFLCLLCCLVFGCACFFRGWLGCLFFGLLIRFLLCFVVSCLVCFLLVSTCDLFVFLWFVFGVAFVV